MQHDPTKYMLAAGEHGSVPSAVIIEKLQAKAQILNPPRTSPFFPGQAVTPRDGFGSKNMGIPYIVVRTTKLERNRHGWGTPAFGKQADMLVAYMTPLGQVQSEWVESVLFERWNSETHGVEYDVKAGDLAQKLDEFKANLQAAGDAVSRAASVDRGETQTTILEDGSELTTAIPPADISRAPVEQPADPTPVLDPSGTPLQVDPAPASDAPAAVS